MRFFLLCFLLMASLVTPVHAAPGYDEALWRASLVVGGDTLRFWADPGIYDVDKNGFMKWDDSQTAARSGCMNCDIRAWGAKEYWQYRMDQMLKEQNPRYLANLTFLFLNVERLGNAAGPLNFRMTPADSVVILLPNGQRYASEPPKDIDVSSAVRGRSEGFELTCRQAELQLGGQRLLSKPEIDLRRKELAYRYARYNEFIVLFTIKDPPRNLYNQLQGVRIYFAGHPIELERNGQGLVGVK